MVQKKIISVRKLSVGFIEKRVLHILKTMPPFTQPEQHLPIILELYTDISTESPQPKQVLYMTHMPRLLDAYKVFQDALRPEHPNKATFNRSPSLYRFCRHLFPQVAHPLIFNVLKKNKDPKIKETIKGTLDAMYDAFCLLVMINTCIDDCADHLQDTEIVGLLGKVHREKTCDILALIPKELPSAEKKAYTAFIECTSFLWKEALHILEDKCGIKHIRVNPYFNKYVLAALDNVIGECMEYSIASHKTDFGGFDATLKKVEHGMMMHVFFPLQECVIRSNKWVNPTLLPDTTFLREQFEILERVTSVLGRIGHDISAFEKVLEEGSHTNIILHLCQDKMKESDEHRKLNLKNYTLAYSIASNATDKKIAKKQIVDLINHHKVVATLYQKFSDQLEIIHQCKLALSRHFSQHPSLSLSEEIQQLYDGNIRLLCMYKIMGELKGYV